MPLVHRAVCSGYLFGTQNGPLDGQKVRPGALPKQALKPLLLFSVTPREVTQQKSYMPHTHEAGKGVRVPFGYLSSLIPYTVDKYDFLNV